MGIMGGEVAPITAPRTLRETTRIHLGGTGAAEGSRRGHCNDASVRSGIPGVEGLGLWGV